MRGRKLAWAIRAALAAQIAAGTLAAGHVNPVRTLEAHAPVAAIDARPAPEDDFISPVPVAAAAVPASAPPVSRSTLFAQLPIDAAVNVFVPARSGLGKTRLAIPNSSAGYSSTVTLTFDDCGEPAQMGAIVDALGQSQRQGLFFVTGQCRDRYPWLVDQLKAAGHQVCNHTYSHPDLRRLNDAAIRAEIAGGVMAGCPYFRPPYGSWDGPGGRVARIASEFGLTVLLWDVDTRDWADADPGAMVAAIRARGGVVLFHLHGRGTVEALHSLG